MLGEVVIDCVIDGVIDIEDVIDEVTEGVGAIKIVPSK
jgi:hypothetical protein